MIYDCAIVGAGFGGLAAALTLAEQGARVVLCESLKYPGGCASTFTRGGWRFESGATLFSGFDDGQLFARWIDRHRLPVETRVPDPLVELRTPHFTLPVSARRDELVARVEGGWGAAMLYLGLSPGAALRPEAHHLELVDDPARPFTEGNHVFCSISGADEARGPGGARTVTASTHVPMAAFTALGPAAQGEYVARVQAAMGDTIARRAPELADATVHRLTASPRTFERFVGRPGGYVGGAPRVRGIASYQGMVPSPVRPGLWMVGDSVFPGQSTLATALGGARVAALVAGRSSPRA